MAAATNIPTGFTQKGSIRDKHLFAQVSTMDGSQPVLDATGNIDNGSRRDTVRSMLQTLRRLSKLDNTVEHIESMMGRGIRQIIIDNPANAGAYQTSFNEALAAISLPEASAPAGAASISIKKLIHSLMFIDGAAGLMVIDNIGGAGTENCFRPFIAKSARVMFRDLVVDNGDGTLRLNTASGLVTRKIATDAPVNITDLKTSTAAAFTASTISTAKATPPSKAKSTSFLNQIQQLLVVTTGGEIAIDDTGETTLARAKPTLSQLKELRRLVEENDDASTFRLSLTSGVKWEKVSDLVGPAVADIVAALTDPA
jgi:hypothetical protein